MGEAGRDCGSGEASPWASSGSDGVPETMSASQSPSPPGAQSMAVCGLYTLIPSAARRSRVFCCESARVRFLSPLKMMGSMLDVVSDGIESEWH